MDREINVSGVSFGNIFRLVFIIFFLYLTGDAFYRWDGFSYYGSFWEFLPSVALVSIIWSALAVLTAWLVWLSLRIARSAFRILGFNITSEHLLLYGSIFTILGASTWKVKKSLWPYMQTTLQMKFAVLLCVFIVALFLVWILREKAARWINIVHERLPPLVWLFGAFILLSIPLVSYHTWFKNDEKAALKVIAWTDVTYRKSPNIILVTFDAMAARDMSVYGYEKDTTPFISEWAKNATLFTRAEAASNFTTSATTSLMTGKNVWTHRTFHIEGTKPVNSHIESLPFLLKKHGYYNMAFVVNPHTSVQILGMEDSFDVAPLASDFSEPTSLVSSQFGKLDIVLYRLFGNKIKKHNWILENDFILKKLLRTVSGDYSSTTVPAEKVFGRFLQILNDNPPMPFFAWLHIFPPHDPYLTPEPYRSFFSPSLEFRTYKSQEEIKLEAYKYLFEYLPFPENMQPAVELIRNYYDEFIRYSDKQFEGFIEGLNKLNMGNTVIILSADHGESFEHGYFTHGGPFLYEQVTNVPLIIRETGQTTGQVIGDRVEQIDVPATILQLADILVPSWMEGRSLMPLMKGGTLPPKPVFSMNFEENRSRGYQISNGSVAVWDGDYKLIHYLKRGESLLFNLKQDPGEIRNLYDKESETGQRLLMLIQDNLKNANKLITERRHEQQ